MKTCRVVLTLLLAALPLAAQQPVITIVSASDTSVTYREALPRRVAPDPPDGSYHFKGCPLLPSKPQWVSPAAAQLKGLKPHVCERFAEDEYATHTEPRKPRDPKVISVLFLGNSLTYYNEAPLLTAEIAKGEARPLRVGDVTIGGASLETLWTRTPALKRLWLEHWDYVVLQERSREYPHQEPQLFHQYVGRFADEARKSGARPFLFMTWLPTRAAAHEQLFRTAATRARATLVPIGIAWAQLAKQGHNLNVDEVHPNVAGSYLIACSLFSTIYRKPAPPTSMDFRRLATGEEYDESLRTVVMTAAHGATIRKAAWEAVGGVK